MPLVTLADFMGRELVVEARHGESLMQAAKRHDFSGILAECGGACACATCGVFVDERWFKVLGPPGEIEASMLELSPAAGPYSRLACQVEITAEMDGLRVSTPEFQQ